MPLSFPRSFVYYLVGCFLLNAMQAWATELTGDEALYWMHAHHMAWGFKDHPPMAGAWIALFTYIFPGTFGVRLATILSGVLFQAVLYQLVKPKVWWHFALLMLSMPILQVYAFMATPDAPLLLFTVLYMHRLKLFLENASWRNTVWLGVFAAGMMWSKYHGLLIVAFTILPTRLWWSSARFWWAGVVGLVLYCPHLIWQILQDLPTVKFQLLGRNNDHGRLDFILGYVGGQSMVFNAAVFVVTVFFLFKTRSANPFERACRGLIVGLWLFFFYDSFRGRVEPHWTAVLSIPIAYLMFNAWYRSMLPVRFRYWLVGFAMLVLMARVFLVWDVVKPLRREFHTAKERVSLIRQNVGDTAVCFSNSYQWPALYTFYTGLPAHTINNIEGGKNQFDFWNTAGAIDHQPFVWVYDYERPHGRKITSEHQQLWIKTYHDFPVVHQLSIVTDEWLHHLSSGTEAVLPAILTNGNDYSVDLSSEAFPITWQVVANNKKENAWRTPARVEGLPLQVAPGEQVRVLIRFTVPAVSGKSLAYLTAFTGNEIGTYQSNRWRLMIDAEK